MKELEAEIPDMHFSVETGKDFVREGLAKYVKPSKIDKIISRYDEGVIRGTGANLQMAFEDVKSKAVKIPSIRPKKIGDFTIEDLPDNEYEIMSPLMGMIVDCCGFYRGSGLQLCNATTISPWFKIMLIKKEGEVQGLTVVSSDEEQRRLVILGLEIAESNLSRNKKNTFRALINYSAEEMLKNSNYEKVLFSAGGKGMPNIGYGSKPEFHKARTYNALVNLSSVSNLPILSLENPENDFKIKDGKKYGFKTLLHIPESAVCVELLLKKKSLNQNIQKDIPLRTSIDVAELKNTIALFNARTALVSKEELKQMHPIRKIRSFGDFPALGQGGY